MAGYLGSLPVPQATQHRETFTATAGQTSFATAGYTPQFIDVYLNGVHLSPADVTATNGSDVVLVACLVNDIVDVVSYTPFEVASPVFTGSATFNEGSADADFRVESNGNENMLFVDGGNNRVGIGTNTPQVGTLHVHTATAGTVTASPQADDLVVESNTEAGITILSPDDQSARIRFSSPSTNTEVGGASILYRQNINTLKVGTAVAGGVLKLVSGADVDGLKIDANGAVTKPLQPAFLVHPATAQNNIAANNSAVTVVFGTEVFDQNADFASNTFTAPVTGKYQLNVNIYLLNLDSASQYYYVRVNTSNRNYDSIITTNRFSGDPAYITLSGAVLADMDASDTALVNVVQQGGTAQTDIAAAGTYFSGYLVA